MKQKKTVHSENLKIVVVFIIFIFFLILGSLIIKLITIYKNSLFDGAHKFTIMISYQQSKNDKEIISFAPDTRSISVLKLSGDAVDKSTVKTLSIPIDANVFLIDTKNDSKNVVKSQLQSVLFSYNKIKTDLTIIDLIRLWLFAASTAPHDITTKEISLTKDNIEAQKLIMDTTLTPQFFTDYSLASEQVSIQIINATGINGLGNRLAKLISNMGGNVISVITSDSLSNRSSISSYKKNTYTVQKLSSFLKLPTKEEQNTGLFDIVILVGKDKALDILSKL